MLAVRMPGDRRIELVEVADPTPGPGEVVVEIRASGMCGSDLHTYRRPHDPGWKPFIAGHEPAGVVAAAGPAVLTSLARPGTRVMVHHYRGCWECAQCRSGWAQLCEEVPVSVYGSNDDGAHARYMKVPAATLVALDERLSFAAGAAISCGTGTAWGALERMGLTGRDTIAIFGQGPVGLSATMLAAAQGARVIALDIDPARLETARAFGAHHTIDPRDGRAAEAIRDLTRGRGADMAMETAGATVAGRDALACLRTWGTACFVGLGGEVQFNVRAFLKRQIRVLTSWTMSIQAQAACADFVIARGLDLDRLFTHRWRLDQAQEAYELFDRQSAGKGVFLM